jgi:hypothetical protein
MKVYATYQGFQEPRNHRLVGGVEPLGAAALLAPVDGIEDELEPTVNASSTAFFGAAVSSAAFFTTAASSTAFFFTAASSATFFIAAASTVVFFAAAASSTNFFAAAASTASFSIVAHVAVAMSSAAELPPDPQAVLLTPQLINQVVA